MTLDEFLARHTSRQLTEIIARDRIDPYDTAGRLELAIAKVHALLFNVHRDRDKAEAKTAEDLVENWGSEYREALEAEQAQAQTPEQIRAAMADIKAAAKRKAGR